MTPPNEPPLTQLGRALADVDDLKATVDHLTTVLGTERATTRRFRFNLAALLVLALFNLIGLGFAYGAASEAKDVGHTLDDCLIPGGACAVRLAQQGRSGIVLQMDYQACWAAVPIEQRGPQTFQRCKDKILETVTTPEGGK